MRRCAVHLNNIRVARARNRVPASFSARFRPRKNITEPRPFLFKQNHLVRHGVFSTLHSGPCFVRLGSRRRTDGRTDGRETRTGRKSSPRCSQSPGEGTGWNDATAYLDHGTRSVTRARTRSRTPRIPRGERVLVACAARVLLNISRVVAADETAAAARPLPVSPIPGKLFGGKGEIWTFARETSNAPGNRALSPTASRTVRACVRAPLGSTSDERAPGNVANGNGARGSRGERLEFLLRNNLFYEPRYPTRFVSSRVGYGIDRPLLRLRPSQPSPPRSEYLFAAAEYGRTAHLGSDSIRFTLEIPPSSPLSTAHGSPRPTPLLRFKRFESRSLEIARNHGLRENR